MGSVKDELLSLIEERRAVVGVFGLGYVGLPLALAFAERGFEVLGFDTDPGKVEAIGRGEAYIRHLGPERVARAVEGGGLCATGDFARVSEADVILICVPTPLTAHQEPDLSFVEATARSVRDGLRAGQLVVLESTTYPGTTEGPLREILEGSGLQADRDFFLAFSPEREDPGNKRHTTTTTPKVVGGVGPDSADVAVALYDAAFARTVRVESARTAEACKLTENVFRAVNIALVNELKVIFDRMGIDIWDVLDAAETKPFGFMRFDPGPGLGGHCIPLDPFYLAWKAKEYGLVTRFIELAGEINVAMPRYVAGKVQDALNAAGKPVQGSKILVLGVAYKKDVDDTRESPAFEIIDRLEALGAEVTYHDPFIAQIPALRSWPQLRGMASVPLGAGALSSQDAVVVVTDHSSVDYDAVVRHSRIVIDTRGVCRGATGHIVKA